MDNAITVVGNIDASLSRSAVAARDESLTVARALRAIGSTSDLQSATSALSVLKTIGNEVERTRKEIKNPVLNAGRKIDELAKEFCSPIEIESARLTSLITFYESEQRRIAQEAELKRQTELRKINDARIAAEHAAAIALEQERKAKGASEAARIDAYFGVATQADIAEAARRESEIRRTRELETQRSAKLAEEATAILMTPRQAQTSKIEGLSYRVVWKFEVLNIHELYLFDGELVTLSVNNRLVQQRISNGHQSIPGLRIWSEKQPIIRTK